MNPITHHPLARATIFAATAALSLSLAACGQDMQSGAPAPQPSATTAAPMSSPSMMATPSASGSSSPMASGGATPMGGEQAAFGPGCSAVPKEGAGSFDGMATAPVATAASANPALSTLVTAVKKAELVDTLNSSMDITVFAPSNEAFAKVDPKTMESAMGDPKGMLTDVLTAHVVKGRLSPQQVMGEHESLNPAQKVTVTGSGQQLMVNGRASVICGNVQTANATVYIIDSVLLPQG